MNDLITVIVGLHALIDQINTQAQANEGFSDEDKARIEAAAKRSDTEWDDRVAAARARINNET